MGIAIAVFSLHVTVGQLEGSDKVTPRTRTYLASLTSILFLNPLLWFTICGSWNNYYLSSGLGGIGGFTCSMFFMTHASKTPTTARCIPFPLNDFNSLSEGVGASDENRPSMRCTCFLPGIGMPITVSKSWECQKWNVEHWKNIKNKGNLRKNTE